jgi:hypothetical protein
MLYILSCVVLCCVVLCCVVLCCVVLCCVVLCCVVRMVKDKPFTLFNFFGGGTKEHRAFHVFTLRRKHVQFPKIWFDFVSTIWQIKSSAYITLCIHPAVLRVTFRPCYCNLSSTRSVILLSQVARGSTGEISKVSHCLVTQRCCLDYEHYNAASGH